MVSLVSIYKQIYRYTHGRTFRHNENIWPWLKVVRDSNKGIVSIKYKKSSIPVVDISSLKCAKTGSINILATGPSVRAVSVAKLQKRALLGVNGAFNLSETIFFDYYVIIDRGFVSKNYLKILDILSKGTLLFTTPFCLFELLKRHKLNENARIVVIEQFNEMAYRSSSVETLLSIATRDVHIFSQNPLLGFSENLAVGIFDAKTVAYAAMQVAVYLGFKQVHFFGLDLGTTRDEKRFYDCFEKESQRSNLNDDFDEYISPSFSHACKILKEKNYTLQNHSLNSRLPNEIMEKTNDV